MRDTDQLDACSSLFMEEIGEPLDNELRLSIVEGKPDSGPHRIDEVDDSLRDLIGNASLIEPASGSRIFELHWPSYIAYSVRNESFCKSNPDEEGDGRRFVRYTRSPYLDFVSIATFASADYPGPFVHYGIFCENHIIDVVSLDPPGVRVTIRS